MASLLDIYMQRNPLAAGVLGPQPEIQAPPSPPPPPPPPGPVGPPAMDPTRAMAGGAPPGPAPGGPPPRGAPTARPGPQAPQGAPPQSLLSPAMLEQAQRFARPESSRSGGVGGVLGRIVGGANDDRLTEEQNKRARAASTMRAGLSMLASDRRGLQALADGLLAGQDQGDAFRDRALQENYSMFQLAQQEAAGMQTQREAERVKALRAEALEDIDWANPAQRVQALSRLIGNQDFEGAEKLSEWMAELPNTQIVNAGDAQVVFDPVQMREVARFELPEPPPDTEWVSGNRFTHLTNKATGEIISTIDKFAGGLSPEQVISQGKEKWTRSKEVRGEYVRDIKDQIDIANAFNVGMNASPDAAGDLTLIQALVRAQDPGVSVRQSDIENVEYIGGLPEAIQARIRNVIQGGELGDKREWLRNELTRIAAAAQSTVKSQQARYNEILQAGGVTEGALLDYATFNPFDPRYRDALSQSDFTREGPVTPNIEVSAAQRGQITNRYLGGGGER